MSVGCCAGRLPRLTILGGLPRSGKTTWCKLNRGQRVVISADDIRKLVYGQRFFGGGEALMWAIRGIMLENIMQQRVDIIIDETNTTAARRKPLIELAKKRWYWIEFIHIDTPAEVCIERAKAEGDDRIIPVIERMAGQFEMPTREEGFDEIITQHITFGSGDTTTAP